jgi:hypothetical protein
MSHTEGDWKKTLRVSGQGLSIRIWNKKCTKLICSVGNHDVNRSECPKKVASEPYAPDEIEANALLIVAAPKLLEACRVIKTRLLTHGEWDEGCFYYATHSASELEEVSIMLHTQHQNLKNH